MLHLLDLPLQRLLDLPTPTHMPVQTRLLDLAPASYDREAHTVEATLSRGSPVVRFYGREVLEISSAAVNLNRVSAGVAPLLDSHRQDSITAAVGRVIAARVEAGALTGMLRFNATSEGRRAEAMVARKEISSVSIGYQTEKWKITDAKGREVEQEAASWRDDLIFTATRWTLLEASLVSVPADGDATIRNYFDDAYAPLDAQQALTRMQMRHAVITGDCDDRDLPRRSIFHRPIARHADIRTRMAARQRMADRQSVRLSHDDDNLDAMSRRSLVFYQGV